MKKHRFSWIVLFALVALPIIVFYSCSDDDNDIFEENLPILTTTEATNITQTTATSGGNITNDCGLPITERGVVWSTEPDPNIENNDGKTLDESGSGTFTSKMTGLSPLTFYYVRAYATNNNGTAYGDQRSFTTLGSEPTAPTTTTQQATDITPESVVLNALVNPNNLETTVIFEYGLTEEFGSEIVAEQSPVNYTTDVPVSAFIDGLTDETLYYFRIVAENELGVSYGETKNFTTLNLEGAKRQKVIVEIGTGTWCVFCPGAAMGAQDLIDNGLDVAIIKYHVGDNFANSYSTSRTAYYDMPGYPTTFFDGQLSLVGGNANSSIYPNYLPLYNQSIAVDSPFRIEMNVEHVSGLQYEAEVVITHVAEFTASNLVLHLAITETDIPFNWFNQTHVKDVLRLMLPDQNGTSLDFKEKNVNQIELSFTLDSLWNLENINLVAFIQDVPTKEIFQGEIIPLLSED